MGPVRIVLADDHVLVLDAFRALLSDHVDVVATAKDGRELIRVVKKFKPDIVVTDIAMPLLNGLDAFLKLRQVIPDIKVIYLTVSDDPDVVAEVIRAGAKGYLLKSSASSELVQAIKAVASGATYITPLVMENMIGSLISGGRNKSFGQLTVRQREILQLLAEGKTMKQAAAILNLTPRTIAFHKYRIMDALHIDTNAQLIQYALKTGLLNS